jgi:Putative Ig domain
MNKMTRLTCLLSLSLLSASAATFTVTPNVVSNDFAGLITFQMNSLSPGETVQVVQFYDFNGNGVVDGPDLAVRGETVTDGQAKLANGATNINVFRDEDAVANGAITASYRFAFAPFGGNGVGNYIFRCSSPSNHFTATNLLFTVASAPYAQTVHGTVRNNATNVPYAIVGLGVAGGNSQFIVGGAADANGHYTFKSPVGTYLAVAFQSGYVGNFLSFPLVVLTPNATVTADIPLIAATTSMSGSVVDSTNAALHAVPYAEASLTTGNGFFTATVCDSNGNFNVPIIPGQWVVRVLAQSAASQSYLLPGAFTEVYYDASTGPVSNANVTLKHATALINGRVEDNHSNAVPGINLSASADGGQFDAFGLSDTNGLYSLAIDAGGGFVEVQELTYPPANNYLWTGNYFGISDGQALNRDMIGIVPTAHFRGHILDDAGAPVSDLGLFADGASATLVGTSLGATDTNGFFDLPVFGGTWSLFFNSQGIPDLIFPTYLFSITDGVDVTNTIIAYKATGSISGYVRDQTNGAISGLYMTCSMTVGSTSYNLNAYTEFSGNYSLPVFNGTWNVSLRPYDLLSRDYNPANPVNVTVPPTNGVANFILFSVGPASGPPRIATTSLPDAFVGQAYYQTLVVTNAAQYLSWSISSGALPGGLSQDSFLGSISGTPTNAGLFNFTVQVTDSRGSNATSVLSINVRSGPLQAPRLDLPALLPGNLFRVRVTGTAVQSYTLQFVTGLTNWTDILTTNAASDVFYLQDTHATNVSRLYRLKVNP